MDRPLAQKAAEEQQDNPMFQCAECSEPVIVYGGNYFRTCEHTEAAIIANMTAVVRGASWVSPA